MARQLSELGFELYGDTRHRRAITAAGLACSKVNKVKDGRPHIVDMIKNDEFDLIVNTTEGKQAIIDSASIRSSALQHKVSYTTTIAGAEAVVLALLQPDERSLNSIQELRRF